MNELEIMQSGALLVALIVISSAIPLGVKNIENWKKTKNYFQLGLAVSAFTTSLYVFILLIFFTVKTW